ncbi:MAG: TadE/TadG family type IV pilus assembly protein [bacterium]
MGRRQRGPDEVLHTDPRQDHRQHPLTGRREIRSRAGPSDRGQSAVEFALVLPLVLLLLLSMVQAGVVLRDQLLVTAAAREAAREAAVSLDESRARAAARRAAPGLGLTVEVAAGRQRGDAVEVVVTASPARLPLVGAAVSGRRLRAAATMRMERDAE